MIATIDQNKCKWINIYETISVSDRNKVPSLTGYSESMLVIQFPSVGVEGSNFSWQEPFHSYRHKKRSVIHHVFLLIWSDSRSTISSNVTSPGGRGRTTDFLTVLPTSREHRKAEKQWGSSCVQRILRCQNAGWIIRWVTIRLNGFTQQALITESRTTHGEVSME